MNLTLLALVLTAVFFGVGGWYLGRMPKETLSIDERRALLKDRVTHVMAFVLVAGFLGVIFLPLLGFVDVQDATVTAFVGVVIGYASAKVEPVIAAYYGHYPKKPEDKDDAG